MDFIRIRWKRRMGLRLSGKQAILRSLPQTWGMILARVNVKGRNTNIKLRSSSRTSGSVFLALGLRGACEARTTQNASV